MWDYGKDVPAVAQRLKLKHEEVTTCVLPSDFTTVPFLLVGTEKGNIFFFRADDFSRSSVEIMWNKVCLILHHAESRIVEW